MHFDELRCFMAVAKQRSFTKAAQELYMAQPSLSKKIMHLEKVMGVQLFMRTKRSVRLTEAGYVLFAEGTELLKHIDSVIEKVKHMGEGQGKIIHVAFLGAIDIDFLPVLNNFRKAYPTIKVELASNNLRETYLLLDQGAVDIIVSLAFGIFTIPDVEVKKLYTDGVSLVVSANHWFIQEKIKDYTQLKDEKFLLFSSQESPHSYEQVKRICATWGFEPKREQEISSLSALLFSIAAGSGIAVLPNHAKRYADKNVKFFPIESEKNSLQVVAAWKKNNCNPAIPLFYNELCLFKHKIDK